MLPIPELQRFAKKTLSDIQTKKIRFDDKYASKIDAYLRMIVDRSDIMIVQTARMQKFSEDIQDGLNKLQKYGVVLPEGKNENPLK